LSLQKKEEEEEEGVEEVIAAWGGEGVGQLADLAGLVEVQGGGVLELSIRQAGYQSHHRHHIPSSSCSRAS
jgi:hypothetical protein